MASKLPREKAIGRADYRRLAAFRYSLRRFLAISETAAREAGITPQHHQALLAIKGATRQEDITVGYLAEQLLLQPHSAAELVDRMVRCGLLLRTKSRTDRRFVILSLTAAAEKALRSLSTAHIRELRGVTPAVHILVNLLKAERSPRRLGAKE